MHQNFCLWWWPTSSSSFAGRLYFLLLTRLPATCHTWINVFQLTKHLLSPKETHTFLLPTKTFVQSASWFFSSFFPYKKGKGSGSIKLRLPMLFFCMKHNWLLQIMDTVWLYVMLDESKKETFAWINHLSIPQSGKNLIIDCTVAWFQGVLHFQSFTILVIVF